VQKIHKIFIINRLRSTLHELFFEDFLDDQNEFNQSMESDEGNQNPEDSFVTEALFDIRIRLAHFGTEENGYD
jgi:hypothetical protein